MAVQQRLIFDSFHLTIIWRCIYLWVVSIIRCLSVGRPGCTNLNVVWTLQRSKRTIMRLSNMSAGISFESMSRHGAFDNSANRPVLSFCRSVLLETSCTCVLLGRAHASCKRCQVISYSPTMFAYSPNLFIYKQLIGPTPTDCFSN